MGRSLAIPPRQIEQRCNRRHLVIDRPPLLKAKQIKQLPLVLPQPPHHAPFPPLTASTSGNHCSRKPSTDFCNKIGAKRTIANYRRRLPYKGCHHWKAAGRLARPRPDLLPAMVMAASTAGSQLGAILTRARAAMAQRKVVQLEWVILAVVTAPSTPAADKHGEGLRLRHQAASSRVAMYSFTARLAVSASRSLIHSEPGIDRCLLASAAIRLASTANSLPPTSPAEIHASTTRSKTRRKMSLSRNRSLRAREDTAWS